MAPKTFDLSKLLTTPLKSRQQWLDLAEVASNVLFNAFAAPRTGLALSNDPEALSRDFKIAAAKTMGLDYRSQLLHDEDYDRMLGTIAQYNQAKGTKHFVDFMGYFKNTRYQLIPLWTKDFVEFYPQVPEGSLTLFENEKAGVWYPTSHVGLAYEADPVNEEADEADLVGLFYKLAPINLVLKWVAAMITILLPNLKIGTGVASEEYITANAGLDWGIQLWMKEGVLSEIVSETTYNSNLNDIIAQTYIDMLPIEWESWPIHVAPQMHWDTSFSYLPQLWNFNRNTEAGIWNKDGSFTWLKPNVPRLQCYNPSTGTLKGWLFEPAHNNLFKMSTTFDSSANFWIPFGTLATTKTGATAPDQTTSWLINDTLNTETSSLRQQVSLNLLTPVWTWYAIMKAGTSSVAAIRCTLLDQTPNVTMSVVVNLATGATLGVNTGSMVSWGSTDLGNGWYLVYGSNNRGNYNKALFEIVPAWGAFASSPQASATGSISCWVAQINQGYAASTPIRTTRTQGFRDSDLLQIPFLASRMRDANGMFLIDYTPSVVQGLNHTLLEVSNLTGDFYKMQQVENVLRSTVYQDQNTLSQTSSLTKNINVGYRAGFTWESLSGTKALYDSGTTQDSDVFFYWNNDVTRAFIGARAAGTATDNLFGYIKQITHLRIAPSDAQMQTITT